jgi:hypothetical protein
MGRPDRLRRRIVMADGHGIEKRGDRAARHRPVEPLQRLLPGGHPELPDTAQDRPGDGRETGGARAVHTPAGPSKGTAPKATAASAMNNSDQRGQNARVARSATMPARVNRRGQIEAPERLFGGRLVRSCALSGGLPDARVRTDRDHTHWEQYRGL